MTGRPLLESSDRGARVIWATKHEDGEQPYTDVTASFDAVCDAIDRAICGDLGWPRLTTASGTPIHVNPAWVESVIPAPEEPEAW